MRENDSVTYLSWLQMYLIDMLLNHEKRDSLSSIFSCKHFSSFAKKKFYYYMLISECGAFIMILLISSLFEFIISLYHLYAELIRKVRNLFFTILSIHLKSIILYIIFNALSLNAHSNIYTFLGYFFCYVSMFLDRFLWATCNDHNWTMSYGLHWGKTNNEHLFIWANKIWVDIALFGHFCFLLGSKYNAMHLQIDGSATKHSDSWLQFLY